MQKGKVKFYNRSKKYGFISGDDGVGDFSGDGLGGDMDTAGL